MELRALSTRTHRRGRGRRSLVQSGLTALLLALGTAVVGLPQAQAASPTVVSLTFDDGQSSQYSVLPMLQSRGMRGTFYINSGMVGSSGYYLTWSQVQELYNAGNEIGGHTLTHKDLTTLSVSAATTEVCDDRTDLVNRGLGPVVSFAYPYASVNAAAESVVASCGYSTGRTVGGLGGGTYVESVPPADPFRTRTAAPGESGTTLADLQSAVTNAENAGGGWVPMVFHGICSNSCTGSNSLSPAIFTAFLDWLQQRSSSGTVVRTVGEVMGGGSQPPPPPTPAAPTTSISCDQTACSTGWYRRPVSVTLSATDPAGSATTTYYTTDGTDPTSSGTRTRYAGAFQVSGTSTVRYFSANSTGQAEPPKAQTVRIDAAPPTVGTVSPTGSISRRAGTVTLSVSAQDLGTGSGAPSGIARVVFYDGSATIGTATVPNTGTSTYSVSWRVRTASVGQHSLRATATDVAGSSTTSTPVTVTVTK